MRELKEQLDTVIDKILSYRPKEAKNEKQEKEPENKEEVEATLENRKYL